MEGGGQDGTVPLARALAGLDRDGHADLIERVSGRISDVISHVHPADLVQVVLVVLQLIEVDSQLQPEAPVIRVDPLEGRGSVSERLRGPVDLSSLEMRE